MENLLAGGLEKFYARIEVITAEILILAPSILVAAILLWFCFYLAKVVSHSKIISARFKTNPLLQDLIRQSIRLTLRLAGVILALQVIGAGSLIGAVLGTAGVVGLALGFAFKDIIENYIAGILLSIRQPFLKGDHVVIADNEGLIQRMTTRMTMIKSFDGNNISIPNATVFKASIINYTTHPNRRFNFTVGINPEANPDFACAAGLNAMKSLSNVLQDPEPFALIDSIGDSSIILKFFGWVDQTHADFGQAKSSSIQVVKDAIEREGIEIPDPTYKLKIAHSNTADFEESKLDNRAGGTAKDTNPEVTEVLRRQKDPKDAIQKQMSEEATSERDLLSE